jgi:hypothetical protein
MSETRNDELIAEWQKDPKRIVTVLTKEQTADWDKTLAPVVTQWEAKDQRNQALLTALRQDLAASRAGK